VRNILTLFLNTEGINPWGVLICLVLASVVEGLGFITLVPLLNIRNVAEQTTCSGSRIARRSSRSPIEFIVSSTRAGLTLSRSYATHYRRRRSTRAPSIRGDAAWRA
jgi:hypothetical protein